MDQGPLRAAVAVADRSQFRQFFYGLLGVQERRRDILMHWHRRFPLGKDDVCLVGVFKRFINTLLYGTVDVCINKRTLSVFTGEWGDKCAVIRKEWLSPKELEFVEAAVRDRERLFMTRKEYENDLYAYGGFIYKDTGATRPYETLVDTTWRRQLLRDFVFYFMATPSTHCYLLELLRAIQSTMLTKRGKSDVFLSALHGGMQGRYPMAQVPCWNLVPWDAHSDVLMERDKKRKLDDNDAIITV
jgi:hypothetical protein